MLLFHSSRFFVFFSMFQKAAQARLFGVWELTGDVCIAYCSCSREEHFQKRDMEILIYNGEGTIGLGHSIVSVVFFCFFISFSHFVRGAVPQPFSLFVWFGLQPDLLILSIVHSPVHCACVGMAK